MDKKVNEKKKKYAIVITFLVLMICITGGTYAYFALTASNNSVTGSVGGASLNLTVTKVYPTSEHNSKNMIPQLESTLDEAISLEHKCIDGNGNVICQVYSATVTNVGSTTSVLNGTISFTGIENMPNLKWMRINDSNTLGTYSSFNASTDKALFEEERSFGANTSNTYYFVFWIDETGEVQTDSGTFRANIEFDSSTGGLTSTVRPNTPLLSDYIISLYNDGSSTTNATVGDGPQTVSLNSTQKLMKVNQGSTYGEEYRYYGASPNNYVDFNGELWRIISVSKVFSSEEDTTGETRVRIIRDESIGYHAWDADTDGTNTNNNNWETSTLNATLNGIYYNGTSGTCYMKDSVDENGFYDGSETTCDYSYAGTSSIKGLSDEARNLIDDTVWYLGGTATSSIYADDYYKFERETTVYVDNPTSTVAKLGIMYPSDYVYAADLSKCRKTGDNYYTDRTNCTGTDWLFNGEYQWLISSYSGSSSFVFFVGGSGYVTHNYADAYGYTTSTFLAQPVAVLKSNVTKLEGEGTSGNPYKLGLGT